jgi:biofilm protein TabA
MLVSRPAELAARPGLRRGLRLAADFLAREDARFLADGRYELDGDRVFALVRRYETGIQPRPRFEAHRRYIDVQYMASGKEDIGWAPLGLMDITESYDPGTDACFGLVPEDKWSPVTLCEGELAVIYPADAHAPGLAVSGPARVTKIVVKVAV